MTTFGIDFVMEPLTGDRPNDPDRVPHYFAVIAERDDKLVRKIYILVYNYVPTHLEPPATRRSSR